jgi:hypothetical protein
MLYNALGQMVFDNTVSAEQGRYIHKIDVSSIPSGIYYYRILDENNNVLKADKQVIIH